MLLQICDSLQPAKLQPFRFLLLSVWRELHESGEPHYHVAINGCRGFRFNPFKKALLVQYGLASHWSASHQHYASAFSYCYMPSDTGRSIAELDPSPLLWPGCSAGDVAHGIKPHPPPAEARRAPVTASATAACREKAARRRAGEGKPEQRLKDFDLWPVVVDEGIKPARGVVGKVVAYAKRCGGQSVTQWCFDSDAKIPEFVARCWRFGGGSRSSCSEPGRHGFRPSRRLGLRRAFATASGSWLPGSSSSSTVWTWAGGQLLCGIPSNMAARPRVH